MAFERQMRNGKGIRAFPFAKNGANGSRLAAALMTMDTRPASLVIRQAQSAPTTMDLTLVPIQGTAGKGSPLVLALMTDVVTEAVLVTEERSAL